MWDTPYDPLNSQTGEGSFATRPGLIPVSWPRALRMTPLICHFIEWGWRVDQAFDDIRLFRIHVEEHLRYGLAEPAIVMALDPLIVAAYTAEIDCVAMLGFFNERPKGRKDTLFYPKNLARDLVEKHNLQEGSRLLAVNTFHTSEHRKGYAADLIPGPLRGQSFLNFSPYIAEFLSDRQLLVAQRKELIEEREWQRAELLAEEYFSLVEDQLVHTRDGRPHRTYFNFHQNWKGGVHPRDKRP